MEKGSYALPYPVSTLVERLRARDHVDDGVGKQPRTAVDDFLMGKRILKAGEAHRLGERLALAHCGSVFAEQLGHLNGNHLLPPE